MTPETVIYALAAGCSERWQEDVICAPGRLLTGAEITRVMQAAGADGFHGFRVNVWDGAPPDFGAAVMRTR